jgi:two-component system heavy metal sensor histidine kinase CusS
MKRWPLRSRLAAWTAGILLVILIIFGAASAWVVYREQIDTAREIGNDSASPVLVHREASELVSHLASAYLTALPPTIVVAAMGVWFMSRRALGPLEEVAEAAEQIHSKNLNQRLPQPGTHDEVERLVTVLNQAFDRLSSSVMQATRFSSDASHELKTPLTIMRSEIESALRSATLESRTESLLTMLLEQTQHLTDIAEKLTILSQADAGTLVLRKTPIDLSAICRDLLEDGKILGTGKNLRVDGQIMASINLQGDAAYIRQLLLNLLDNAVKYNYDGGEISIGLTVTGKTARFEITNSVVQGALESSDQVFDRFYRTSNARSSSVPGSGLGLSICREIVLAHQGRIWFERPGPDLITFVVTLPIG